MMRICLFEQQFTSISSIQQNPEKPMKKPRQKGSLLGAFKKSDFSTMETIPNCTKYHCIFRRKLAENLLQLGFSCDILE